MTKSVKREADLLPKAGFFGTNVVCNL